MEVVSPLDAGSADGHSSGTEKDNADFRDIKISYLLISPLQGLVTKLATMWSETRRIKTSDLSKNKDLTCDSEEKLILNDTLAIFGNEDIFSTNKKLRLWADRLGCEENSRFQHVEIVGAGHFWHEEGVVDQMRSHIEEFVSVL